MLSSIFSGDSKPKEAGSFDLTSFVGSVAGSTQKKGPSGSKSGVENLLDVSSQSFEKKKFVSAKSAAKPSSKPSTSDDKKPKDSKDYGHSSQSHRNGHSDDSRNHKRDDKPRDSSRDYKDSDRSKNDRSSRYEDYNPLGGKEESFDVRIKKKLADGQDAKNGEYSIKKTSQQPSSPKIKKADPSPSKRPDAPSSKPKPAQPQSSRPNGDSKSSSHAKPSPHKSLNDSMSKKPSSGSSQPSSRPQSAKPTSSSPAPSKSQSSKPVLLGSLSGKPISKPMAGKPSPLSKPSGSKPMSNGSMGSKPLSKPGSMGSKPLSSQVKKDFTSPLPKPSSQRPVSSQPSKPVPGKPMGGAPPPAGSKEALRRQMEERRRKEEALKGKRPMESAKPGAKPGSSNLGKRPLDRPDPRHEPGLVKKPMLSMSDKKQALNSIFKGAPKSHKKRYDSEDDDYDENDSFIDDGDEDAEAMKELSKMFTGYRRKVQMSKPYEDDIDNMEVGYDRIIAEEEWTKHVGEIEDRREQALIEQEMEEERQALQKRKRKLKI